MVQSFSAVFSVASSPRHWTLSLFFLAVLDGLEAAALGTHGEPTDPYRFLEPKQIQTPILKKMGLI